MTEDTYQKGLKWLKEKDPQAISVIESMALGSEELTGDLVRRLYGEQYSKSSYLSLREKLIAVLAITVSSGTMQPQTSYQSRLAFLCGLSDKEMYEICSLAAIFSGFSNSLNSMNTIRDSLANLKASNKQSQSGA